MMTQILQLPLGPIQTNAYLLADETSGATAVIDPGWDGEHIVAAAQERGWTISHILLTHTHWDHIGGLAAVKEATGAPIYAHPDAIPMLQNGPRIVEMYGLTMDQPPDPDVLLTPGDHITVGTLTLDVLYTPGHAPGHVSFYLAAGPVLFDGDVLFQGSIGRTDLPGGDMATLMQAIEENILPLPDETQILSGHGPATTLAAERQSNPFLQ